MMILWTNDPLIKRNLWVRRLIGMAAAAKAQVAGSPGAEWSRPRDERRRCCSCGSLGGVVPTSPGLILMTQATRIRL
jgi:hypothetical protein